MAAWAASVAPAAIRTTRTFDVRPKADPAAITLTALVGAAGVVSVAAYALMFLGQRSLATSPAARSPAPALAAYVAATAVLFLVYAAMLRACRGGDLGGAWGRRLALGVPIAFYALALLTRPTLSIDLLSYVSHGYIRVELGRNPYLTPSSIVASTPLGPDLARYGWRPVHPASPYGPLWTDVEVLAVRSFSSTSVRVLTLKLMSALTSLASAGVIWGILSRRRPADRLFGTVAYLWNPMIVAETAGDGHNDAAMALLVLIALGLTLRRPIAGFVTTALAALTKYVPLIFLPAQSVHMWRTQRSDRRRVGGAATALIVSTSAVVIAFAPYWAGARTFTGLSQSAAAPGTGSATTIVLEGVARLAAGADVDGLVRGAIAIAYAIFVVRVSLRVRDGDTLLRASAWIAFGYLLASPTYWPWYAVLPVAVAALVPERPFPALLLAMSLGARLVAPLDLLFVHGWMDRATFLVLTCTAGLGLPTVAAVQQHQAARRGSGRRWL
jgi:hypothetical protein